MSTPSAHFIKDLRTPDQIDVGEMVLPLVVIDVHKAVGAIRTPRAEPLGGRTGAGSKGGPPGPSRPPRSPRDGPGRSEPAPARHHEPFQKTFFFRRVRGAAGRPPGERQEGRLGVRCGTPRQTEPQERRTSSSVLGARRGRRSGRPTPRQLWRPALPVPPAGPPPSELRRALTSERPGASDPTGRNAEWLGSAWCRKVLGPPGGSAPPRPWPSHAPPAARACARGRPGPGGEAKPLGVGDEPSGGGEDRATLTSGRRADTVQRPRIPAGDGGSGGSAPRPGTSPPAARHLGSGQRRSGQP